MYLRVEHRKDGFRKSWKLESSARPFSIGQSKNADIRLDSSYPGILGVLECKQGLWTYTHLHTTEESLMGADTLPASRCLRIEGPTTLSLKAGELQFTPLLRQVDLFRHERTEKQPHSSPPSLWLVWKRNERVWYSEWVKVDHPVVWPHNLKPISLKPTTEWQSLSEDGLSLQYKLAPSPALEEHATGAHKSLFDPSMKPFLLFALVACLFMGLLPFISPPKTSPLTSESKQKSLNESTVLHLEKRTPPPAPPKTAVAKALAQTTIPKSEKAPQVSSRRALGQVFSQIGRRALKNIAIGTGPKTIAISKDSVPTATITSAKTFKVLGSLGSGTGLGPAQFTKGLNKDGGAGLGDGTIGGKDLGQISQGRIGQGDIGLLHKESQVTGGLDREVIARFIQNQKGRILYCYERQLSANPGLFGKVSVRFEIAASGLIDTTKIVENTLGNSSVESCLLQLITSWQFPKPEGGVRVLVNYPFVFKSLN